MKKVKYNKLLFFPGRGQLQLDLASELIQDAMHLKSVVSITSLHRDIHVTFTFFPVPAMQSRPRGVHTDS